MTTTAAFVGLTGNPETDGLLFGTVWRVGAGGTATTTLTYSFATYVSLWPGYGSVSEPTTGFAPMAATAQQAVRGALLAWSSVANLQFQEVTDDATGSGTLRIGYTTLGMGASQLGYAYVPNDTANGGDVWLNAQLENSLYASFTPGSLSSYALIHELGHALGLKHPHAESPLNSITLGSLEGNIFNSVMSYYAGPDGTLSLTSIDRLPSTPMSLDIDALQALYGANTTFHNGNDTYSFDGNGKYLETIYDTGGNDTIQVTGTQDTTIDLRANHWSQIGIPVQITGGAGQNADTVRIYRATQIENAIGGDGNDLLTGNDGNNQLTGNGGNDTLVGSLGDDTLTGGSGADIFVLAVDGNSTIADFNPAQGDRLSIGQLLPTLIGYTPGDNLFTSGFLTLSQSGADTLVNLDRDGAGSGYFDQPIARLPNTTAAGITGQSIIVSPSAPGTSSNLAPSFYSPGRGVVAADFGSTSESAERVLIQSDGKVLIVGSASDGIGSNSKIALARYDSHGVLDAAFGDGGKVATSIASQSGVFDAAIQADGKILVAGYSVSLTTGNGQFTVIRYSAAGSIDTSFGSGGIAIVDFGGSSGACSIATQADGKIVVAGYVWSAQSQGDFALARLNDDGTPDISFDGDGKATTVISAGQDRGEGVVIQPDGKIIVAGTTDSYAHALSRYNADGSLDTTFSDDGVVTGSGYSPSVALQADGKILVGGILYLGGYNNDFVLSRYGADGSLDVTFGVNGTVSTPIGAVNDSAYAIAVQVDGKIILVGQSVTAAPDSYSDIAVLRYNPDGSLDNSFSGDGISITQYGTGYRSAYANTVALQEDGKIVVAGTGYDGVSGQDFLTARYNIDGTLDYTFASATAGLQGNAIHIEGGNAIVLEPNIRVADAELTLAHNYAGATLTLMRHGSAAPEDVFAFKAIGSLFAVSGNELRMGSLQGSAFATFASQGGTLTINFAGEEGAVSNALVNDVIRHVTYANTSDNPPETVQVDWLFSDGNMGGQGTGPALTASGTTLVSIVADHIQTGSSNADNIAGTNYPDLLLGLDGIDTINGGWSDDTLTGGLGNDFLIGGQGTDRAVYSGSLAEYTIISNENGSYEITDSVTSNGDDGTDTLTGIEKLQFSDGVYGTLYVSGPSSSANLNTAPSFRTSSGIAITKVGLSNDLAKALVIQLDGKIIVAGSTYNGNNFDIALLRYGEDGSLDSTLNADGKVTTASGLGGSDEAFSVALQADGKILVSGRTNDGRPSLIRYWSDGGLDASFGGDGIVVEPTTVWPPPSSNYLDLAVLPSGKILAAGSYPGGVVGYLGNGSLDAGFGSNGQAIANVFGNATAFAVQADGSVLLASSMMGSVSLARLLSGGAADPSFGSNGVVSLQVGSNSFNATVLEVLGNGKILIAGDSSNGTNSDLALKLLNGDGSADQTFGANGEVVTPIGTGDDHLKGIAIQTDGKILAVADTRNATDFDLGIVRYNSDGSIDLSFGDQGKVVLRVGSGNDHGTGIAVQDDGKILVLGDTYNGTDSDVVLARFNQDGTIDDGFGSVDTFGEKPIFRIHGSPVLLEPNAKIQDAELTDSSYAGASLTLSRHGGASTDDVFSAKGALAPLIEGGVLRVSGTAIGTVTHNSGGILSLGFNAGAVQELVDRALQSIGYQNISDTPPTDVMIDWNFSDGNVGSQGSGGTLAAMGSTHLNTYMDQQIIGTGQRAPTIFGLQDGGWLSITESIERFNAQGESILHVAIPPDASVGYQSAAMGTDGKILLTWLRYLGSSDYQLAGYLFDPESATFLSVPLITETLHAGGGTTFSVTSLSTGGYGIAWTTVNAEVRYQALDSNGTATSLPIIVKGGNSTGIADNPFITGMNVSQLSITGLQNGKVLTQWTSSEGLPSLDYKLYEQFLSDDGSLLGSRIINNISDASHPGIMNLLPLGAGGFIGVWSTSNGFINYNSQILGQHFSASGEKIGAEVVLSSFSGGGKYNPSIAELANGNFVATWNATGIENGAYNFGMPTGNSGVFGRLFGADLVPIGDDFRVNYSTTGSGYGSSVAGLSDGTFVVGWETAPSGGAIVGSAFVKHYPIPDQVPVVANPIPDREFVAGAPFAIQIPSLTFNNLDPGDALQYQVKLANGNALPQTAQFNAQSLMLTGALGVGTWSLKAIATDMHGKSAEDVFSIAVYGEAGPPETRPIYQSTHLVHINTESVFVVSQKADGSLIPAKYGMFDYSYSTSSDGRYIAFYSDSPTVVSGDTNNAGDIFLKDLVSGDVSLVSANAQGVVGNGYSTRPSISGDGKYAAFVSFANNFDGVDLNNSADVFVKDLQSGALHRVTNDPLWEDAIGSCWLNFDGSQVAFSANMNDLAPGDTNGTTENYLADRFSGSIQVANQSPLAGFDSSVSDDGRYFVYGNQAKIYIKDTVTGLDTRMDTSSSGADANSWSYRPVISGDGNYIVFYSNASNLDGGDGGPYADIFVKSRVTGDVVKVSKTTEGFGGNASAYSPEISGDGRYVFFGTEATNLVDGGVPAGGAILRFENPLYTGPLANNVTGGSLGFSGYLRVGSTLTVVDQLHDGDGLGPRSYQWQYLDNSWQWGDIAGAVHESLILPTEPYRSVRVVASYTDGNGRHESVATPQSSVIQAAYTNLNVDVFAIRPTVQGTATADGLGGMTLPDQLTSYRPISPYQNSYLGIAEFDIASIDPTAKSLLSG